MHIRQKSSFDVGSRAKNVPSLWAYSSWRGSLEIPTDGPQSRSFCHPIFGVPSKGFQSEEVLVDKSWLQVDYYITGQIEMVSLDLETDSEKTYSPMSLTSKLCLRNARFSFRAHSTFSCMAPICFSRPSGVFGKESIKVLTMSCSYKRE